MRVDRHIIRKYTFTPPVVPREPRLLIFHTRHYILWLITMRYAAERPMPPIRPLAYEVPGASFLLFDFVGLI